MNADERLTALKKAYADIILNTAKEAAARIMVSERKALRFQHELFSVKEESLQMLLRLKRMMDSKTSEAEMASLSQQKKVEELELQLQEAEDIVKDLREELREVQDELERAAKKEVTHLNHGTVTPRETSGDNRLDVSQSTTLPPPDFESTPVSVSNSGSLNLDRGNEGQMFFNSLMRRGNSYVSNCDLPSIILRSKEPELYRNGCTQRVRACERTPSDRELSFSDKLNDEKDDSAIKEEKGGERVCKAPVHEPDNKCNMEKSDVVKEDHMVSSWQQVRVVKSIRKKRKRTTRFTNIRNPSCRYQTDQIKKINQAPGASCLNICSSEKGIGPSGEEDTSDMVQKVSSDTDGQGKEYVSCDTKPDAASSGIGLDLVKDGFASTRQDRNEGTEKSDAPTGEKNIEKVYLPFVTSESKALDTTRVIPPHPVTDRVIKYTFQRKRKRETLNSSEGNTRENLNSDEGSASVGKQDVGKKENGSLEPEKSDSIEESSRDRRLSQVAHQLVSMSGKGWWQ